MALRPTEQQRLRRGFQRRTPPNRTRQGSEGGTSNAGVNPRDVYSGIGTPEFGQSTGPSGPGRGGRSQTIGQRPSAFEAGEAVRSVPSQYSRYAEQVLGTAATAATPYYDYTAGLLGLPRSEDLGTVGNYFSGGQRDAVSDDPGLGRGTPQPTPGQGDTEATLPQLQPVEDLPRQLGGGFSVVDAVTPEDAQRYVDAQRQRRAVAIARADGISYENALRRVNEGPPETLIVGETGGFGMFGESEDDRRRRDAFRSISDAEFRGQISARRAQEARRELLGETGAESVDPVDAAQLQLDQQELGLEQQQFAQRQRQDESQFQRRQELDRQNALLSAQTDIYEREAANRLSEDDVLSAYISLEQIGLGRDFITSLDPDVTQRYPAIRSLQERFLTEGTR